MTALGNILAHTTRQRARLPTDGLVAGWDFARVNLLKTTEDLTVTSWGKGNITLDGASTVTAPNGSVLQLATNASGSQGSNSVNQYVGAWNYTGGSASYIVKDNGSGVAGLAVVDATTGTTFLYFYLNLVTGALVTSVGAANIVVRGAENLGGGCWRLYVDFKGWTVGNIIRLHIGYLNTGTSAYLGAPQLQTRTLMPYEAQGDGQTWPDLTARGLSVVLGTTTGSETTDPATLPAGLQFDGIDDRASRAALTDSFTGGITMHTLATLSGTPGGSYHGLLAGLTGNGFYPRLLVNNGNVAAQYASGVSHVVGSIGVPTDRPVGITATYDGAASRVYLNGALVGTAALSGNVLSGSSPLYLGLGAPGSNTYWLAGTLHGAYVYNRALSAADVLSLHRATRRGLHVKGG